MKCNQHSLNKELLQITISLEKAIHKITNKKIMAKLIKVY